MNIPVWVKPGAWGAVLGAGALAIVGFSAGWVVSSGKAEKMAVMQAEKATLAAMTPICVAQFNSASRAAKTDDEARVTDAASRGALLAALEKEDSWKRGAFVTKQGWATMPGAEKPNSDVATACANELMKLAAKEK